METKFRDANADVVKTDLLVLPVQEKNLEEPAVRALNRRLKGKLSEQIQRSKFTGAEGSSLSYSTAGTLPASHLLLIGFGKANDVTSDTWRRAGARARKEASVVGAQDIAFFFAPGKDQDDAAQAVVEGATLASYRFNKYRSNFGTATALKSFTLFKPGLKRTPSLEGAVHRAEQTLPGVFLARDLVNEPLASLANKPNTTVAVAACRSKFGARKRSRR